MKVEYKLRKGFQVKGDVQKIGERLYQIQMQDDEHVLKPESILRDAEDEESPLHEHFEWNNEDAARKYRLVQARYLSQAFRIKFESNGKEIEAPAYINLRMSGQRTTEPYRNTITVFTDQELRKRAIAVALEGLRQWKKKYEHFTELEKIFVMIETVSDDLLN